MNDDFGFLHFFESFEDDQDDGDYQDDGGEDPDDDEDETSIVNEDTDSIRQYLDFGNILSRFEDHTEVPQTQLFVVPYPTINNSTKSPFSTAQWDLLRTQCRMHFGLLCRSLHFIPLTAPSDAVTTGLVAMIHSFS